TITAYPNLIGIEEIGKLAWDLPMGYAPNKNATILDSKNVHYSASQISWYYTANGGTSRETVTTVSKPADGSTTYYIASLTLTATNGYCFKEYTNDELLTIKTTSEKYKFTYATTGKNKVTLEISGIIPVESFGMSDDKITGIAFDTERVIPYRDNLQASDLYGYLPSMISVSYGTAPAGYITISTIPWKIYGVDGRLISGKITAGSTFYATYSLTELEKEFKKQGKTDSFHLLTYYGTDNTPEFNAADPKMRDYRKAYWTIKVEVPTSYTGVVANNTLPIFTFNNDGTYNVATSAGTLAGTSATAFPPSSAGITGMTFASGTTVSGNTINGPAIYAAWGKRGGNTASPVIYKYYDRNENNIVSGANLTVTMPTVPTSEVAITKAFVYRGNINGDESIKKALDFNKIWTVWTANSGGFIYDNGVTKFAETAAYTLNIYIPVKRGYQILGGTYTLASTDPNHTGYAYVENNLLHITYYFQKITDKLGFISARGIKKKVYFKNFDVPIAGMSVPKKLDLTDKTANYMSFISINWLEEGKNFTGTTFTAGKRYEATVILNASKGFISADSANVRELIGDYAYVISALADKTKQTIEIRYAFGICPTKKAKSIESILIEMDNGVSLADFKAKVNEKKTAKVTFTDGSIEYLEVTPGFKSSTTKYSDFYEQFTATYSGSKGYDPAKTDAQSFTIYGNIDLSKYSGSDRNSVKIEINVKAEDMCTVTFDAYGGVYLGEKTMKVKKNGAYGFSYDPAKIYREGYFFAGWYLKPGDNYDAVDRVWSKSICKESVTLYAHWLKTFTGIVWQVSATSHSKGSITVKWDNIKTLYNGFEVEISRDGIIWSEPENVGKAKTKYYTGLESGKYYYVRVRAYRYDSAGKIVYGSWNNKLTKVKVK
ncbi:MAG: InlB B-repeat-containing protein, partial [Lachnospiraceae bacterium]|nr:InlB B-repeat-containing protein [Lachnospiraceae bacterium]